MSIKDLVVKNRSYRSFDVSRQITKEELLELVDTARLVPSAMNRQPLKYKLIVDDKDKEFMLSKINLAAMIKEVKLPPVGHEPSAYILICVDDTIRNVDVNAGYDIGIASQTILLAANEKGLGGCIVASFDKVATTEYFNLGDNLKPIAVIILGKPDEMCLIVDTDESGSTAYYRKDGIHYVPKRKLNEIIID